MKKYFLFFVLLSITITQSYSQKNHSYISQFDEAIDLRIDSLKNYPKKDTTRAILLLNIAHSAVFKSQKEKVLPYAIEGYKLSKELNFKKGICQYFAYKGGYLISVGKYHEAIQSYDSIYLIKPPYPSDYHHYCGFIEQNKGKMFQAQENYFKALDHYFLSLNEYGKQRKTFKREENKNVVYTNIAQIYYEIGNYANAKHYAELLLESDKTKIQHGYAWLLLLNISFHEKNYTKTNEILETLEAYKNDSSNIDLSYHYFEKKGTLFMIEENYDSAYYNFKKSYEKIKDYPHPGLLNVTLSNLSKSALAMGNMEEAKAYSDENLLFAEQGGNISFRIEALKNSASVAHASGNQEKAYQLMQEAIQLKDSLVSETNLKQMNTLNAMYEFEQNKEAISKLNVENNKKETINKVLFGSTSAILVIGFMGYLTFQNRKKLQSLKITQLEKDKQILAIEAMLQGEEKERGRIAKDLHDGLGGLLTGTKLSFASIKEKLPLTVLQEEQFQKNLDMLDLSLSELRKVAQNLMPEALSKYGLYDALKDYCNNIQGTTNINLNYQQLGPRRKLDDTAEVFIYRIIQELVTNAIKHSNAKEIILQLAIEDSKIFITVDDNGTGIKTQSPDMTKFNGKGLENISSRLQYLNGSMDITSEPDKGTSINIEINA